MQTRVREESEKIPLILRAPLECGGLPPLYGRQLAAGRPQQAAGVKAVARHRTPKAVLALAVVAVTASAQTTADDIIKREVATTQAYDTLEYLTDNIGPRLSGSTNAAAAVRWATETF